MRVDAQTVEDPVATSTRSLITPNAVCSQLAKVFDVRPAEVALLRRDGEFLRFIFPQELAQIGSIPINGSAVAARTARSRRAELSNEFVKVRHGSVFESVRLQQDAPMTIQKLMSVPIIAEGDMVVGVVQISRKGATRQAAGPDFRPDDLQRLKQTAAEIASVLLPVPDV